VAPGAVQHVGGAVNVAFAGSLLGVNEMTIGPEFQADTGTKYTGEGMGAVGMSKEIASGEVPADVFESIGPYPLANVQPKFSTWSIGLVASPIVIAYSSACPKYGSELTKIAKGQLPVKNLFSIMEQPGVHIARSDPNTDPQGQAFYEMVNAAQTMYNLPAGTASKILGPLSNPKETFSETSMEAYLETGQVCLESDYEAAAIQSKLSYITLPDSINFGEPNLDSTYANYKLKLDDGSTVHGVPTEIFITPIGKKNLAQALAFITYQLQPAVRAQFKAAGYQLVKPVIVGTGAPASIKAAVAAADKASS
jgi:molybdate/tungstate transport system substrate-binding protein